MWAWVVVEAHVLLGSRLNDATIYIAMFLQYLVLMNVSLAVFNLIPVPPLDGSRILLVLLPRRIYFGLMKTSAIS